MLRQEYSDDDTRDEFIAKSTYNIMSRLRERVDTTDDGDAFLNKVTYCIKEAMGVFYDDCLNDNYLRLMGVIDNKAFEERIAEELVCVIIDEIGIDGLTYTTLGVLEELPEDHTWDILELPEDW